ncbi:hypothetical protein DFH11DRAFT_1778333 [Phellopilus nigrolimitatus]|nr:hypothetical protein DFH11DRAFT_1778333 [Phellopilus nigrolimitatus]
MSVLPLPVMLETTYTTLKEKLPAKLLAPKVGIVCGSGLSTLADSLRDVILVPYEQLEGFGKSTVLGHKSLLAFGLMGPGEGVPIVAMLGRFHPYEGYPLATVTYPIRVMKRLGVENVIITNAAGALNPDIPVGTIVVIRDHLAFPNLTGSLHPLLGPVTSPAHLRFLPLSDAGTYAWVSGPTYETPAEGRLLRAAGADVVGMSTVPEVVVAREEGMQVAVLSLVTNPVVIPDKYRSIKEEVEAELAGQPIQHPPTPTVSHAEVLQIGKVKADIMRQLVELVVSEVPKL